MADEKSAGGRLLIGLGLAAFIITYFALKNSPSSAEEPAKPTNLSYEAVATAETACTKAEDGLYRVRDLAVARDAAALDTLLRRGDLVMLAAGTPLRVIGAKNHIAFIRATGGAHIDTRCYLQESYVRRVGP